jgi:hypothetical protein
MNRTVTTYLVLLIGMLGASYMSWTAEDTGESKDGVVLVAAEADDLTGLSWISKKLEVVIEVRKDSVGSYLWVELLDIKEKPKPKEDPIEVIDDPDKGDDDKGDDDNDHDHDDAAHDEGAEDEVEEAPVEMIREEKRLAFMAGAAGDKLMASLAPLMAKRMIEVSSDKVEAFGLDEPTAVLTIRRSGKPDRVLEIGGEAYGIKDRYVRDRDSGKIYLVESQAFKPLQYAKSRLPERNLMPTDKNDVVQVVVQDTTSGESVTLEHKNRDDRDAEFWATAGSSEANDVAEAWLAKVFRLRSAGFVQTEDLPTGLEAAFVMTVTGADGTATEVTVSKGNNADGKETWYAKSTHTRELVKLHKVLASEAAEDLATVLNNESEDNESEDNESEDAEQ